jgi:hypothetical protein
MRREARAEMTEKQQDTDGESRVTGHGESRLRDGGSPDGRDGDRVRRRAVPATTRDRGATSAGDRHLPKARYTAVVHRDRSAT